MRSTRRIRAVLSVCFFLCLCFLCDITAEAKQEDTRPHLIQGISEQSEWEGMLTLGMLEIAALEEPDLKAAQEQVLPSVVAIKCGSYLGSGSIFAMESDAILLVTARHVVMYDTQVEVCFIDDTKVPGEVVGISTQFDLAFVKVMLTDIPYFTRTRIRQVNIDLQMAEELDYGSDIFMIGSTDGVGKNQSSGTVLDPLKYFPEFSSFMIHSYCSGKPGMSGGGTFDAYGNYIGMLTGGLEERSASLPLSVIWKEYENL